MGTIAFKRIPIVVDVKDGDLIFSDGEVFGSPVGYVVDGCDRYVLVDHTE